MAVKTPSARAIKFAKRRRNLPLKENSSQNVSSRLSAIRVYDRPKPAYTRITV